MRSAFQDVLLCAATWVAPFAAAAGELTLFQDSDFRGRAVSLRSDTGDLSRMNFNDKASSIIVRSGSWEVCRDANYRGSCRTLRPGYYSSLPGMNDAISSVREAGRPGHGGGRPPPPPRPQPPDDMRGAVLLFPDVGMRGRPVRLEREARDLSRYGFNDRTVSVVVNYGRWEFCVDANYRGRCMIMGPGDYARLHGMERRISSVRRVR